MDDDGPATRAELAEAITNLGATAARIPTHWVERKAIMHQRINDLLDLWQRADG